MHSSRTFFHQKITELQQQPEFIRNICILAHVDHGKTTLSDSLICTNNIISPKLAGKLRYLDSRPDEQERCITMKSSSISLIFDHSTNKKVTKTKEDGTEESTIEAISTPHLINLIDSPGHVDFSYEVAAGLRLCDGGLVVVDVVEGVCSQTSTVMKQAWDEKVQTCLVLNKVDRLIEELEMTPLEAFQHLMEIIEQVNAILSSFLAEDVTKFTEKQREKGTYKAKHDDIFESQAMENTENKIHFSPEKGNVVFSSAYQGWAFSLPKFAKLYAKNMGFKPKILQKYMWGFNYYNAKEKKVTKTAPTSSSRPMFVQFILEPIWKLYEAIVSQDEIVRLTGEEKKAAVEKKKLKIKKMLTGRQVKIPDRDLDVVGRDARVTLQAAMSAWLPTDRVILDMVIEHLPSPHEAQAIRIRSICQGLNQLIQVESDESRRKRMICIKESVKKCDNSDDAPVVIFASKLNWVPSENILRVGDAHLAYSGGRAESKKEMIAFARIFSGKLSNNSPVYVLGPKHLKQPTLFDETETKISNLYLCMGQYMEEIQSISAGNIVGIGGVGSLVPKTATISSWAECPSLTPTVPGYSSGLIKVAVETENIYEMGELVEGLKKLNRVDPSVETYVQESGEYILTACGEVHLERCLKDLREEFAKVNIQASPPLVNFRETVTAETLKSKLGKKERPVYEERKEDSSDDESDDEEGEEEEKVPADLLDMENLESGNRIAKMLPDKKAPNWIKGRTANQECEITIRCVRLPSEVAEWLDLHQDMIREIWTESSNEKHQKYQEMQRQQFKEDFLSHLEQHSKSKRLIRLIKNHLCAFGPKRCGPNLLLNKALRSEESLLHKSLDSNQLPSNPTTDTTDSTPLKGNASDRTSDVLSANSSLKANQLSSLSKLQKISTHELLNALKSGFEVATAAGPLCEEPMYGTVFIVEELELVDQKVTGLENQPEGLKLNGAADEECANSNDKNDDSDPAAVATGDGENKSVSSEANSVKNSENSSSGATGKTSGTVTKPYGPFSGQILFATKTLCRKVFMNSGPRLVESLFKCSMLINIDLIGKLYSTIMKRRGRILSEEAPSSFIMHIQALIPVQESFGFEYDIRKVSSGAANPQLVFHGWDMIDLDPFYAPTTEEELEEWGDQILPPNAARIYMDDIRKKKGLAIETKIVVSAEKQRNMSKNK